MNTSEIERVFSIAITRELEANDFYTKVAKKATDSGVREIFEQLAKDEMGHFELLERYQSDPTLSMKIVAPESDYKLAETIELPPFTDSMKPAEAIALAMKKEQQAVEFYRALSASASDSQMKSMLDNLAAMELGHKHKLENVYVDIGYPESF